MKFNESNDFVIPTFNDVEDLKTKCGAILGGDHVNPVTGLNFDFGINQGTLSVSVALAFRDSILRNLSKVLTTVSRDKRFKNVAQKGNTIVADLVTPIGEITKVEFGVEKDRV